MATSPYHSKSQKRIRAIMAALLLTVCVLTLGAARPALAATGPGTINLTQTDDDTGKPVAGGFVAIFQVGERRGDAFYYVSPFKVLGDDLNEHLRNDHGREYIDSLAKVADSQASYYLPVQEFDSDGKASFDNLPEGVYLLEQVNAAPEYNTFRPFIVTIPKDGSYVVNASPKMDPVHPNHKPGNHNDNNGNNGNTNNGNNGNGNTPTNGNNTPDNTTPGSNTPNTPGLPEDNGGPNPPSSTTSKTTEPNSASYTATGEKLPQTGQLWWPIWALLVAGGVLVIAGVAWRHGHANRG